MVLGKHFRSHKDYKVTHPGLGLFNFVGEGHSSEQNKQPHLEHHLQRFPDLDFVLGIDEDTVVEIDETGKIIDSWWAGTYSYRPWAWTKQDTVDWRDERNNALTRSIHCTSYIHALQILNSLTSLIEQEWHHPDISIRNYKELVLSLTTHDEWYSVTEKDRRLARIINKHLIVIENEVQPIS